MKIGILTHPQGINYGGILQGYALYTVLKKMGHEPIIIQRGLNKQFFIWECIRAILRFLHFPRYYSHSTQISEISHFFDKYLKRTKLIRSYGQMRRVCHRYNLDAVIVGSDQVWRTDFAMKYGYNYFLDFVPDHIIKVSYAASFGLSEWGYSSAQTRIIKGLLSRFKGISVREDSGVMMCQEHLGIIPELLLDPTMLLDSSDYDQITTHRILEDKYVFVYWLGDVTNIEKDVEHYKTLGYNVVLVSLRTDTKLPSVESWLSYIKYADIVLTDSFHGCIFSILFNKTFKIYNNKSGGFSRLETLIKNIDCNYTDNGFIHQSFLSDTLKTKSYNFLISNFK